MPQNTSTDPKITGFDVEPRAKNAGPAPNPAQKMCRRRHFLENKKTRIQSLLKNCDTRVL